MMLVLWVIGSAAGFIAAWIVVQDGFGRVVDIAIGAIGGLIGGWVFSKLRIIEGGAAVGSTIAALVGAIFLTSVMRALKPWLSGYGGYSETA